MDAKQLQAIEQRWAGKKWTAEQSTIKQEGYTVVFGYSTTNREIAEIAAAPTDIALLLAEVRRLQAECEKLKNRGNCKDLFKTCKAPGMEPRCDKWEDGQWLK